jgi:TRAP transporter TAXI family solute receptor
MIAARLAVLLAALLAFASATTVQAQEPRQAIIGTAAFSGVYNQVGAALCRFVSIRAAVHGVRCRAEQSGGSRANIAGLLSGDVQLAIVEASALYDAVHGLGAFASAGPQPSLRMVMRLYEESITLVARGDAGIAGVADLRGKRVSLGPEGSGTRPDAEQVLAAAGLAPGDLAAALALSPDEHNDAMCAGRIDAYFYVVGHPNGNTRAAIEACDARIVPLAPELRRRLVEAVPYFSEATILGSLYPRQQATIPTVAVAAVLAATDDTPADIVALVIRGVQDNLRDFRRLHPVLTTFSDAHAFEAPLAPLHPGTLDRRVAAPARP